MSETATAIEQFTKLAVQRAAGSLSQGQSARLHKLEQRLKSMVDFGPEEAPDSETPTEPPPPMEAAEPAESKPPEPEKPMGFSMAGQDAMAAILGGGGGPDISDLDDLGLEDELPDTGSTAGGFSMSGQDAMAAILGDGGYDDSDDFEDLDESLLEGVHGKDKKKLRAVKTQRTKKSGYTPPISRDFMSDYYDVGMDSVSLAGAVPSRAISAKGGALEISKEVETYFGVQAVETPEKPDPLADAGPEIEPAKTSSGANGSNGGGLPMPPGGFGSGLAASPPTTGRGRAVSLEPPRTTGRGAAVSLAPPKKTGSGMAVSLKRSPPSAPAGGGGLPDFGPPQTTDSRPAPKVRARPPLQPNATVHLLDGTVHKGEVASFDPNSGFLNILLPKQANPTPIAIGEVREVYFAPPRGQAQRPPSGQRIVVVLIGDKQLVGVSPDYAPGVSSLTLIPEPRPPNLDYIWVPAWSVTAIQLA